MTSEIALKDAAVYGAIQDGCWQRFDAKRTLPAVHLSPFRSKRFETERNALFSGTDLWATPFSSAIDGDVRFSPPIC
jgi:hypothetical protein